jgi:poly-gamma-glutamate capsule biosynthesis protein CapA/YwtB (metallophosphatase superfamily)
VPTPARPPTAGPPDKNTMRLFLCGDVMTGRGIDQVLPHPCDPILYEAFAGSALDYVHLAERAHGPIPRPVTPGYIWGAALEEFDRARPDARLINLETSVTRNGQPLPKGINYRMSPENADCLTAAGIDCCTLANNHVLDWGPAGLDDTLANLKRLGIKMAGAGHNAAEAGAPAVVDLDGKGRLLVFSFALPTSGVPLDWAATREAGGVNFLPELTRAGTARICEQIAAARRPGDVVVVSIHWGGNWGYTIPKDQQLFARTLIDHADVSIVHGHSSHHAKAIEVYRNRLILYGCGDFLNDYEGISGYEEYRGDLPLMYFADIACVSGDLLALEIVPLQIRRFQLVRPSRQDVAWIATTLDRESRGRGASVVLKRDERLALSWPAATTPSAPAGSSGTGG